MKIIGRIVSAAALSLLLSACAATGATFTKSSAVPAGMGQIVFYRPKGFEAAGASVGLIVDDVKIDRLRNGQFIKHAVKPGMRKLNTQSLAIDRVLELDVRAGKTYYVVASMRLGVFVGSWELKRVYENDALKELATCCKSG